MTNIGNMNENYLDLHSLVLYNYNEVISIKSGGIVLW